MINLQAKLLGKRSNNDFVAPMDACRVNDFDCSGYMIHYHTQAEFSRAAFSRKLRDLPSSFISLIKEIFSL
jgi:hypothetical protein